MYYKIKKTTLLLITGMVANVVSAQIVRSKVGDNPFTIDKSAVLELESLDKGFLPPRMTKDQRNAIKDPAKGLQVWCTDCNLLTNPASGQLCVFLGEGWVGFTMVTTPLLTTNTVTKGVANAVTVSGTLENPCGDSPTETGVVWREITGNDFAFPVLDASANAAAPAHKTAAATAVTKAGDLITITNIPLVSATGGKRPWYFRTYAKNSFGIGYSKPIIFNDAPPVLSNPVVSNGNTKTPVFAGRLTVNAGTPQGTIKEYGYCSSMTNDKPTIAEDKVVLSATPEGIAALAALDATLNSKSLTADPVIDLAVPANLSKTYFRYYVTTTDGTTYYSDEAASFTDPVTGGTAVAEVTGADNLSAGVPLQLNVAGSGTIAVHFKVSKAGTYAGFVPESKTGSTTGLTMSPVPAGTFAVGDQTLLFTVSGTPETTAEGNVFTVSRIPIPLKTGDHPWWDIRPFEASCNGGTPTTIAEIHSKTGKIWMDRNLGASRAAASYNDYKAQGCLYQWGRGNDDHASMKWTINTVAGAAPVNGTTERLSQGDNPGYKEFIIPSDRWGGDWRSTFYPDITTAKLWQGVKGVNNPCPSGYRVPTYAEFGDEIKAYSITNTATAYETFKFTRNCFRSSKDGSLSDGSRAYYWTSTVSTTSGRALAFSFDDSQVYLSDKDSYSYGQGFSVRCIKDEAEDRDSEDMAVYTVTKKDPISNSFKMGQTSGNTIKVYFNVTKAGKYKSFAAESKTGPTTGLTLETMLGGNFVVGEQTLDFTISGTPAASLAGNTFEVPKLGKFETGKILADKLLTGNIRGGDAYCDNSHSTTVSAVYSDKTGRVWMDRNLGASRAATGIDDFEAYGCLFQWGRGNDGHASINWTSGTAGAMYGISGWSSDKDIPNDAKLFITAYDDDSSFFDWRVPQNPKLWQGVDGINNPCPAGYRIPTVTELESESIPKSKQGGFESILKLVGLGYRNFPVNKGGGDVVSQLDGPVYWSSNVGSLKNGSGYTYKAAYRYHLGSIEPAPNAYGYSVRCIRDNPNEPVTDDDGKAVAIVTKIDPISSPFKIYENSKGIIKVHLKVIKAGAYEIFAATSQTGATTGLSMQPAKSTFLDAGEDKTLDFTISGKPDSSLEGNYFIIPKIGTLSTGRIKGYDMEGSKAICDVPHETTAVEVKSAKTGRTWMDRNLGASRKATSIGDNQAYGCLYQWGRSNDGHASITWTSSADGNLSESKPLGFVDSDNPGNFFIRCRQGYTADWRYPQNDNLWQGLDGKNNPCPGGYRLPSIWELTAEFNGINNTADAFNSELKFVPAGSRSIFYDQIDDKGSGFLWSSTLSDVNASYTFYRTFTPNSTGNLFNSRALGMSVRCIKN